MSLNFRPVIGMPVQRKTRNAVFSQSPEYAWAVEYAGGIPMLMPLISDILPLARLCDGFILTGSYADVNPELYGADVPEDNYTDDLRDKVDYAIMAHAEESGKPVFGICRGCQVMNVYRGGTLAVKYSDLIDTKIEHNREPEDLEVHRVNLIDGSIAFSAARRIHLTVNSLHRQVCAVPASSLNVAATSEDGLIESVEDKQNPSKFFAVQWHPELLAAAGDPASRALFDCFVDSVRESVGLRLA